MRLGSLVGLDDIQSKLTDLVHRARHANHIEQGDCFVRFAYVQATIRQELPQGQVMKLSHNSFYAAS
jgi:hypothetical protein